jgi:hypothetical protein
MRNNMPKNLLTNITAVPDLLRMIVAFLDPHHLAHIKQTCQKLRRAIKYHVIAECVKEAKERYSRVERLTTLLRLHSRLGRRTYEMIALQEGEFGQYLLFSHQHGLLFRGSVCQLHQGETELKTTEKKRHLFHATSIRTVHIFELEAANNKGRRILLMIDLRYPGEENDVVRASMYFCPCSNEAPFACVDV